MKDAEVRRVREEMQYFKLELVNRENNFNKVFARSPNVGLMNPLQPASASSSSRSGVPGGGLSAPHSMASSTASTHLPTPPGATTMRPSPAVAPKPRRRQGGGVAPQLSLGGDSVSSVGGGASRSRAPSIGSQSFRSGARR